MKYLTLTQSLMHSGNDGGGGGSGGRDEDADDVKMMVRMLGMMMVSRVVDDGAV